MNTISNQEVAEEEAGVVADDGAQGSQEQAPDGPAPISLSDLEVMSQIVDLAVQRGAFRANEVERVGAIYNKVTTFLQAVAVAQQQETTQPASNSEKESE